MRSLSLLVWLLALVPLAIPGATQVAEATPFGMWFAAHQSPHDTCEFARVRDSNVDAVRFEIWWGGFQPTGPTDWHASAGHDVGWSHIVSAESLGLDLNLVVQTGGVGWATGGHCVCLPGDTCQKCCYAIPSWPPDSVLTQFGDEKGWYPYYYDFVTRLVDAVEDVAGAHIRYLTVENEADRTHGTCKADSCDTTYAGNTWCGTMEEYGKLLQTAALAVHRASGASPAAKVTDSGLGSECWGLLPAYWYYHRMELGDTSFPEFPDCFPAQNTAEILKWVNSYFDASGSACWDIGPWTKWSALRDSLDSYGMDSTWAYLRAVKSVIDSIDAFNLHLYDNYQCTTGDVLTDCLGDVLCLLDAFFERPGLAYISNEFGRNKLTQFTHGPADTGDTLAYQVVKSLVTGLNQKLGYIGWYKLDQCDNEDICKIPFWDIDCSRLDLCPMPPIRPPRAAWYAFRNLVEPIGNRYEACGPGPEIIGDVRRYIFRRIGGSVDQEISYLWLHDYSVQRSDSVNLSPPLGWQNVIGYRRYNYRNQVVREKIGVPPYTIQVTKVPTRLEWIAADDISCEGPSPPRGIPSAQRGTSWEFFTKARVGDLTYDVTPWAEVTKSETPQGSQEQTSLYRQILTAIFPGPRPAQSVAVEVVTKWASVPRSTFAYEIGLKKCSGTGLQSVTIQPPGPIVLPANGIPFPAAAWAHYDSGAESCNVSTHATTIWSSNDARVATVDQYGRITPFKVGTCFVSAKHNYQGRTRSGSVKVEVGKSAR